MVNRRSSHRFWVTLILCLCLGSLAVLPILSVNGSFVPEILETESENYNPLEPAESDEDWMVASVCCQAKAGLIFSKSRTLNLDFYSAAIASVFPPPKYS